VYQGKILPDDKSIEEAGLEAGQVIQLIIQLK